MIHMGLVTYWHMLWHMLWKYTSCSPPIRSKKMEGCRRTVHLQAWRMPSPAWVFMFLEDVSLSWWHLFEIFKPLFWPSPLLWSFHEGASQGCYHGSLWVGGLAPFPSTWWIWTPLFPTLSSWYFYISFLFSLLHLPVSPCPSFRSWECVVASPEAAFPSGDRKGVEGWSKERGSAGEGAVGHTESHVGEGFVHKCSTKIQSCLCKTRP